MIGLSDQRRSKEFETWLKEIKNILGNLSRLVLWQSKLVTLKASPSSKVLIIFIPLPELSNWHFLILNVNAFTKLATYFHKGNQFELAQSSDLHETMSKVLGWAVENRMLRSAVALLGKACWNTSAGKKLSALGHDMKQTTISPGVSCVLGLQLGSEFTLIKFTPAENSW